MERLGRKVERDSVRTELSRQKAASGLELGGLTARQVAFFPQDVRGRERGVAAQVDFDPRREPAKVES